MKSEASIHPSHPLLAHQIRVHLQYLGHPIPNDPIYGLQSVWSVNPNLAKGGIDTTPAVEPEYKTDYGPQADVAAAKEVEEIKKLAGDRSTVEGERKLMPRETGQDIGSSSPVLLSEEAREIIRRLRRMKDESEDWARCVLLQLRLALPF